MVFSSLLFLFAFLTPQLIIYYLVPKTSVRNIVLLVFSLIFYAWGGPKYLLLLLLEAFVSWYTAREIGRTALPKMKKCWLVLDLVIMFGLLGIFKYTGFFLGNLKAVIGVPKEIPTIILPIGISFYTFQLVSYVVDVYRNEVPAQQKYFKILLYASLFHQCIAGPIVRYQTVAQEIDERSVSVRDFSEGIRRFSVGLAKKAILANGCGAIADQILPEGITALQVSSLSTVNVWLAMFCYMLQIYLDFSAYSDMAIGMGRMVGFHYLENFNYPYIASSVQDFWRRWHMSLSGFFRDYVYIPLGGNRKGAGRTILNMFVVWFLTGMWHGASWNYIFWGLYFFVFLTLERLFLGNTLKKSWKILGHVYTLIVVYFGWVLFRITDMGVLGAVLKAIFGAGHSFVSLDTKSLLLNNIFFLILSVIAVFPIGKSLRDKIVKRARKSYNTAVLSGIYIIDALTPGVLIILSVLALVGNSYNAFLYFQF